MAGKSVTSLNENLDDLERVEKNGVIETPRGEEFQRGIEEGVVQRHSLIFKFKFKFKRTLDHLVEHSYQRRLKRLLRIFCHQRRQKPRELALRQQTALPQGIHSIGGKKKRYVARRTRPKYPRFRSAAGIGRFEDTRFPWL